MEGEPTEAENYPLPYYILPHLWKEIEGKNNCQLKLSYHVDSKFIIGYSENEILIGLKYFGF